MNEADYLVLIDTLQTNLRSCVNALEKVSPGEVKNITRVQSFKWSMSWRPEPSIECEFCGEKFAEGCGKYGCPNCHGEGLDE